MGWAQARRRGGRTCRSGTLVSGTRSVLRMGGAACMACGSSDGARERPVPLRTVACDACWDDAVHFPDREPERIDVALAVEQLRPGPVVDPREEIGRASW